MRVALVAYLEGRGGAEKQITSLANQLYSAGHEVYFIVLAYNNFRFKLNDSIKIIDCTNAESKKIKMINRFVALRNCYKKIKPDVSVHFWFQSAYFSALLSNDITGKVIYSERGDPSDVEYSGILGLIRKLTIHRIDGFVFQTKNAQLFFDKSIRKKSTVIPNAVFLPNNMYVTPCVDRKKKIINVGRLHPQKNQMLLINAFSQIAEQFCDYRLEIYGDGELKVDLENRINELGIQKQVVLYPSRPDIFDCIYDSELFVLSSDFEGMPNVLMEAMGLGVPVISTDCKPGGARELINDNKNGYIVSIGSENELANAMSDLLRNREKAEKMANAAMKIRVTHAPKEIYNRWLEFLEKVYER